MGEDELPGTLDRLRRGMEDGEHVGAQLYVSIDGRVVADLATGLARPGVGMTPDSVMLWLSATKSITAVAVAQQWELGELDLEERVADHIPAFGANGKEAITIRHLLTHTGGFRTADDAGLGDAGGPAATWDEAVARICAAPLEPGWVPGRRAGYHRHGAHVILGELVRLIDGRPFGRYTREAILEPLGARDFWVGLPPDRHAALGDRVGTMFGTDRRRLSPPDAAPQPIPGFDTADAAAPSWPSRNGRGPAHDLARVLELLAGRGERAGVRLLSPQTVDAMTAHQRVGMFDHTFGLVMDWGLGLVLDSKYALAGAVQPYGYGAHASSRAFGHSGSQSSVAFADPEFGLVVALLWNGMCGEAVHTRRQHATLTALYDDLGLHWD